MRRSTRGKPTIGSGLCHRSTSSAMAMLVLHRLTNRRRIIVDGTDRAEWMSETTPQVS
jgi:hypothetical protein